MLGTVGTQPRRRVPRPQLDPVPPIPSVMISCVGLLERKGGKGRKKFAKLVCGDLAEETEAHWRGEGTGPSSRGQPHLGGS